MCNKSDVTKHYLPNVRARIHGRIKRNAKLTAVITSLVKTKSYLYRFKISDNATCSLNTADQTVDQILKKLHKPLKKETN